MSCCTDIVHNSGRTDGLCYPKHSSNTWYQNGIKLPDCEGQPVKEAKICMFADDTQLLNKNEESVEQSFLILSKFEKASGSKINYEKTKGLFIGRLRGKRPRLTNISWISDNIKTL